MLLLQKLPSKKSMVIFKLTSLGKRTFKDFGKHSTKSTHRLV